MPIKYIARVAALQLIRWYQRWLSPDHSWLSGLTSHGCRFRPTCSEYNYLAIERYGIIKGLWLGGRRILRCNPLSAGGYDPIPE